MKMVAVSNVLEKNVPTVNELINSEAEKVTEADWTDEDIVAQVEYNYLEAQGVTVEDLEPPEPEPEPEVSPKDALVAAAHLEQIAKSRAASKPEFEELRRLLPKVRRMLRKEAMDVLEQKDIRSFFKEAQQ